MIFDVADYAARANSKIGFGIWSPQGAAKALRDLANHIEAGRIIPQEVEQGTFLATDDFVKRQIVFDYIEKKPCG